VLELLEVLVRKMQKPDVDEVMEIEKVSFGTHHWSRQSFISEIKNTLGYYYSAFDQNTQKLIGYCGFWLICEEAHVTTIAVHPEFRKRYVGEILLQHLIDVGYERECKWFTLEVRASNFPAQNLYYKYGFKSLGLRRKYYQDNNEDALIMWTQNIWESEFKSRFNALKEELKNKNELIIAT